MGVSRTNKPSAMDPLLNNLDCYLDRKYQWSGNRWTRASIEALAHSSGLAQAIIAAHGEQRLKDFLDRYFYQSVPHFDKNADEQPRKKRARPVDASEPEPADALERARKRYRADPATITDDEIAKQWLRCAKCFKPAGSRDAYYVPPVIEPAHIREFDVLCLSCWDKEYKSTRCAHCAKERTAATAIYATNYGPDYSELYLCNPCCEIARPKLSAPAPKKSEKGKA
jgi:hypothetical protein